MKYAVTAKEMKAYDNDTIERIGLASEVLMERAALVVVEEILNIVNMPKSVLVMAGTGNNGGDGIAIGRILLLKGIKVDIYLAGAREKCTPETLHQLQVLENLGFSIQSKIEKKEYAIIVDALFGVGLSREVEGTYRELIQYMNVQKAKGSFLCAVDMPSGISADTGEVLGCGVKADLTVTFAFAKRGHLFYPGKEYTGLLKVRDIGITEKSFREQRPEAFYYEEEDLKRLLPVRRKDGNKGTFGKVLLIAGSEEISGACLLCGKSIFRTGAGMVKVITHEHNRDVLGRMLPEAMLYTWEKNFLEEKVQESLNWADVTVIGPGLGTEKEAGRLMKYVLNHACTPIVADADALNLIAGEKELEVLVKQRGREGIYPFVFTPHPGELLRICRTDMAEYRKDRLGLLDRAAKDFGAVIVGKDAVTVTVSPDKEQIAINVSGNDGMATAGSGDVLAGVIGGLLSQGMVAFEAAALGVYLHAAAGDLAASKRGRHGMLSGEIADAVGDVLHEIEKEYEKEV